MPYRITLDQLPAGYAAKAKRKGDKTATIRLTEFVSSEDGDLFISRLEGFPSQLLRSVPPHPLGLSESTVDHLLAIIHPDRNVDLYVNELSLIARAQAKRDIKAGEAIYDRDIVDIQRLVLKKGSEVITVPPTAGVVFVFSFGWRKGMFYDLSPLRPACVSPEKRNLDLELLFGQYYTYVMFQHMFKISESVWEDMFEQQWFPFIALTPGTVRKMISHVKEGWPVDELLDAIHNEVEQTLPKSYKRWETNVFLHPHYPLLHRACERYLAGDHVSACSILFPRIEGILRTCHFRGEPDKRAGQKKLVETAIRTGEAHRHSCSLLLPDKLRKYLHEVYFAQFDPNDPNPAVTINRNTVSHGLAPPELFSLKASTIGLLIVEQLSYYLALDTDTGGPP